VEQNPKIVVSSGNQDVHVQINTGVQPTPEKTVTPVKNQQASRPLPPATISSSVDMNHSHGVVAATAPLEQHVQELQKKISAAPVNTPEPTSHSQPSESNGNSISVKTGGQEIIVKFGSVDQKDKPHVSEKPLPQASVAPAGKSTQREQETHGDMVNRSFSPSQMPPVEDVAAQSLGTNKPVDQKGPASQSGAEKLNSEKSSEKTEGTHITVQSQGQSITIQVIGKEQHSGDTEKSKIVSTVNIPMSAGTSSQKVETAIPKVEPLVVTSPSPVTPWIHLPATTAPPSEPKQDAPKKTSSELQSSIKNATQPPSSLAAILPTNSSAATSSSAASGEDKGKYANLAIFAR